MRSRPLDSIAALGLTVVAFDEEMARLAASLRPATRPFGLSLADRACLALARQRSVVALTTDRAWAEPDLGVRVELLR